MADSMKFGPEWLRSLSDGPQPSASTPAVSSKFKLADYRYGREEMLALYQDSYKPVECLHNFPHVFVEETQKPMALLPQSEEEQRLVVQGVNSQAALRTARGGAPALRGGRGGGGALDRGRGRGRGRGEPHAGRGSLENGDLGGGFGRPRGPNKDGWEEVGSRKLDRGFSRPYEDSNRDGRPRFGRSMSDNWREKGSQEEEDESEWKKPINRERWNARSNWRDHGSRSGADHDWRNDGFTRGRELGSEERGHHIVDESWGSDDVPEWAGDGADDVGTFDSSGAFVFNKQPGDCHRKEEKEELDRTRESLTQDQQKEPVSRQRQEGERKLTRKHDNSDQASASRTSSSAVPRPQDSKEAAQPATEKQSDVPSGGVSTSSTSVIPNMPRGVTLSNIVSDEKTESKNAAATSVTDENAFKWYYTDPQGEVQGPFISEEMSQWFSAGYFTMNLLVKRGCDHQFQPLGELMKRWGHVPFLPGPQPPPLSQITTASTEPDVSSATAGGGATAAGAGVTALPAVPSSALSASPALSLSKVGDTEQLLGQQQLLLQHQIVQLQTSMRQLQMQTLSQLQEDGSFKSLDPAQQQQISMQLIQSNPVIMQHMQQLQQLQLMQQQNQEQQRQLALGKAQPGPIAAAIRQQQQSAASLPGPATTLPSPLTSVQRTVSQPAPAAEGRSDVTSIWDTDPPAGGQSSSQPSSVWDLDNPTPAAPIQTDLEKIRQEMEAERKRQEEIRQQQEELRRQTEALQRERERMEREKEELERQRLLEQQRVEEIRRQKEEEEKERQRLEEERRKQEQEEEERKQRLEEEKKREERERRKEEQQQRRREEQQKKKEEQQRKKEEEKRKEEERRQQEEEEQRKREESRRKREAEEKAFQEMKRQEELQQQQEVERQKQLERQKQVEAEKQQEAQKKEDFKKQQQEALKRLQQQQAMNSAQLPSSVQWARQQAGGDVDRSRTLMEIQQEEEARRQQQQRENEELRRAQAEEMVKLQQQQQQQQKSWASSVSPTQVAGGKTLAEIQREEERQQHQEKQKAQQRQQYQAKTMTLSQATAWGSGSTSTSAVWGGGSVWGEDTSQGLWGSSAPTQAPRGKKTAARDQSQTSSEFPSLYSQKSSGKSKHSSVKSPPVKSKKEEEAVQRLFKASTQNKDDFTLWCEAFLEGMDVQIDVETFVSFLQAVDSPSEIHDYVRNYLGDGKNAREFAKQFLEKRSQHKNKAGSERQEEDSIWGPATAAAPQRLPGTSLVPPAVTEGGAKAKGGKKKKKMQKLDGSSLLGFTVQKDPNRKNAGEIERLD